MLNALDTPRDCIKHREQSVIFHRLNRCNPIVVDFSLPVFHQTRLRVMSFKKNPTCNRAKLFFSDENFESDCSLTRSASYWRMLAHGTTRREVWSLLINVRTASYRAEKRERKRESNNRKRQKKNAEREHHTHKRTILPDASISCTRKCLRESNPQQITNALMTLDNICSVSKNAGQYINSFTESA